MREETSNGLPSTGLAPLLCQLNIPGEIELPNGKVVPTSMRTPTYRVIFTTEKALTTPMTEMAIGKAYLAGEI
jgi:cyclopropane-fatty-acyl-phospholipid synthase